MKNLLYILLLFCSCALKPKKSVPDQGGSANSTVTTISQIKFSTGTRGFQKSIRFTKDSVLLIADSRIDPTKSKNISAKLTTGDWDKLIASLSGVELDKMNSYESPSHASNSDGAYQSSILINTASGEKYSSNTFDDYNPNEKLKKLMDVIAEIEKKLL